MKRRSVLTAGAAGAAALLAGAPGRGRDPVEHSDGSDGGLT